MKSVKLFILYFILVSILFTGCFKSSYPDMKTYSLDVSDLNPEYNRKKGIIKLDNTKISPKFNNREFNYKTGKHEFESDYYNQFFQPVDLIIKAEIYKWLSNSGLFKAVVDISNLVDAKYILYSKVIDIYADLENKDSSSAVLSIQFQLVDDSGEDAHPIFTSNYQEEIVMEQNTTEALVDGWNTALKNILQQLENDLEEVI